MGFTRSYGIALKIASLVLSAAAIGWILWLRFPDRKITDQKLLREAVEEWKRAGEPGNGPDYQIFEQQAAQGYYEDAAETATLFKNAEDRRWSVVELAKIRAENGDIPGAKAMIKRFAGSALDSSAIKEIALAQVGNGDLQGALDTAAAIGDQDDVFLAFARRQIESGNFDGALRTAEQMNPKSVHAVDSVFYEIGDALRVRGERNRVHDLAAHMTNRQLAASFTELVPLMLRPSAPTYVIQLGPCDIAYHDAAIGQFAEADALVQQNKCPYGAGVASKQYAVDPSGAERLLQTISDPKDKALGLADFGIAAANKGHISEALRFYHDLESLAGGRSGFQVAHTIARTWTIQSGPKAVLKWARSRPTTEERTWALIGMAEALGHGRRRS
jgi:tetratricopeptide (TPR) repeat protein